MTEHPTARVSGRWEGGDAPSKQEKPKAKITLKNAARTHLSTARCVGPLLGEDVFYSFRHYGSGGLPLDKFAITNQSAYATK